MKVDSNGGDNPSVNEGEQVEEPKKGMCFSSREEVYTFMPHPLSMLAFLSLIEHNILNMMVN